MLRFLTSGESHGSGLTAILDGMPAGLPINLDVINQELWRRQQGYGRGNRQKIESDKVDITGGVRHGKTTGAPIGIYIVNADWKNWQHAMSVESPDLSEAEVLAEIEKKAISRFRPGHADLSGTFKFRHQDIRNVLERASARETAARTAVGAICMQLLSQLGIKLVSHVVQVGEVKAKSVAADISLADLEQQVMQSEMFCADAEAEQAMKSTIKAAWQEGDSLGGVVEILADGCPVGLGSYTQWDSKLDGQLAQALMCVQAMKAVEIGDGVAASGLPGSQVHDALYPSSETADLPFSRTTNHAGGIEGGMTNGERLRLRVYMKPIPTLRKGLPSVSYPEFQADRAHFERSDVCAISAASIVCKAMVSFVLARAVLEKFGGDSIEDISMSISEYRKYCRQLSRHNQSQSTPAAAICEGDSE